MKRPLWAVLMVTLCVASACGDDPPPNVAPEFIGVDSEYRTQVDQPVRFEVVARDPEGGAVTLTMEKGPETAQFAAPDAIGRFNWAPISSDAEAGGKAHEVIFAAVDNQGARSTLKTIIVVEPTDGTPRFVTTNQRVLDLSRNSELVAEVKVKDDDSTRVEMTLEGAPDGMVLTQLDDKSAELRWTPSEEQVTKKLVWGAMIVADDGATEPVTQALSVILVSKACGDTGLTINHEPLGEQRGLDDYAVTVSIPNAEAGSEPTLFWRKGGDPNDSGGFEGVAMLNSAGSWTGIIPNPLLPEGKTDDIYYFVVSVGNNDDGAGEVCVNRAPDKGFFSFAAFPPGDTSCRQDAFEPNNDPGSAPTLDIQTNDSLEAYNLSLCEQDRDLFAVDLVEGEGASVLIIYREDDGQLSVRALGLDGESVLAESANMIADEASVVFAAEGAGRHYIEVLGARNSYSLFVVKREGVDASCIDNLFEPNDSATSAIILPPDTYEGLKLCPGDEDYFGVEIPVGNTLIARVFFSHAQGDIDLFLRDFNENVVGRAVSSTDNEELIYTNNTGQTLFTLRMRHYDDAPKDYRLELVVTEDVGDVCLPDFVEPNDSPEDVENFQIEGSLNNFNATMCGDDDYYAFMATAGEAINAEVSFDAAMVDLDIALLDSSRAVKARSEGTGDTESFSFVAQSTGLHFLHVYRYVQNMGKGPYTIDLTFGAAGNNGGNNGGTTCRVEDTEPNDAIAFAVQIEGDEVNGLGLCEEDVDWWVINASQGQDLLADIIPEGTNDGDPFNSILVELYASDGSTLLDTGVQVNQTISIGTSNTAPDFYLIRVENIDDAHWFNYRIEALVL